MGRVPTVARAPGVDGCALRRGFGERQLLAVPCAHSAIEIDEVGESVGGQDAGCDAGAIAAAADGIDGVRCLEMVELEQEIAEHEVGGPGDVTVGPFGVAADVKNGGLGRDLAEILRGDLRDVSERKPCIDPGSDATGEEAVDVIQTDADE